MHNNDLITGGVGIVFGRLDAKNAFKKTPIKFVSFVIYPSEGLVWEASARVCHVG